MSMWDVRNLSAEDVSGWSVEGNLYDSEGKAGDNHTAHRNSYFF